MKLSDYIKSEIKFFNTFEKTFYTSVIVIIIISSFAFNDGKIALISALCGITYTFLAGKGKVYAYYIGLIGTAFYCFIAFKNGFYGNMALYGLYFFPMQVIGIFNWKKHLNKEKNQIFKTTLKTKERFLYFASTALLAFIIYQILLLNGGKSPILDAFVTAFSVLGQLLTVKRCFEQWIVWSCVNFVCSVMWLTACINGAHYFATLLMWLVYFAVGIYFLFAWKKEMKN